ncbi:EamA family transporter RarD [Corynebacterium sp. 13CS0277]|uniref:EamA family transporter RarD n=1 Tax=Corynebacterium sp. 13CS0277 TaxID=2071994 RepID=UPI000D040916|nr:EamA family transporter RarD [Corynebacterium sp. 13CS0277]PRQ11168.1 EamA family transporter RarD [Corynebacterium sp. 13CS0277]
MLFALAAYLLWGAFPAYFPLLQPATPLEILAHRIVWTAVVMLLVLVASGRWRELVRLSARTWAATGLLAVLIATNWLLYVITVNSDHVAEAALGYFINPLVSVALGMLLLGERVRGLQLASVVLAVVAVAYLTIIGGQPPLLGLGLALSFGFYGLLKKQIGISAATSLAAETLILAPLACGYLLWLGHAGRSTFLTEGAGHAWLLISTGVVTAVPLLLFGIAARRIPLSTVGMLQYITPTLQMLWAVFVVDEQLDTTRWVGFVLIWVAVALYLWDVLRQRRRAPRT